MEEKYFTQKCTKGELIEYNNNRMNQGNNTLPLDIDELTIYSNMYGMKKITHIKFQINDRH